MEFRRDFWNRSIQLLSRNLLEQAIELRTLPNGKFRRLIDCLSGKPSQVERYCALVIKECEGTVLSAADTEFLEDLRDLSPVSAHRFVAYWQYEDHETRMLYARTFRNQMQKQGFQDSIQGFTEYLAETPGWEAIPRSELTNMAEELMRLGKLEKTPASKLLKVLKNACSKAGLKMLSNSPPSIAFSSPEDRWRLFAEAGQYGNPAQLTFAASLCKPNGFDPIPLTHLSGRINGLNDDIWYAWNQIDPLCVDAFETLVPILVRSIDEVVVGG